MIFKNSVFDGGGHVISNILITREDATSDKARYVLEEGEDRSVSCTGFFNVIKGKVKNLGLENIRIHGFEDVGAFAGCVRDGAVLKEVYAIGGSVEVVTKIQGGNATLRTSTGYVHGDGHIGGLVGFLQESTIERSYTDIKVDSSRGEFTGGVGSGGLVGKINSGKVMYSYAHGDVHGNFYVGGLIGDISSPSNVLNSYATGDVFGGHNVGGLIGRIKARQHKSEVLISYALGNVKVSSSSFSMDRTKLGALVGLNQGGSIISDSFSRDEGEKMCSDSAEDELYSFQKKFFKKSGGKHLIWNVEKGFHPILKNSSAAYQKICK